MQSLIWQYPLFFRGDENGVGIETDKKNPVPGLGRFLATVCLERFLTDSMSARH